MIATRCKKDRIHPGQLPAAALQFFGNDPPTWFVDRRKTALSKLCQQSDLPPPKQPEIVRSFPGDRYYLRSRRNARLRG